MAPINGMTDRGAALTRIGIIRKGGAKTGNRPGPDLSYFRFVSEFPEVAAKFQAAYGDKPTQINAYLLFDEVESNWEAWREHWVAGGLKHRCDGDNMVLWQDKDGQYHTERKRCPDAGKPEKQRMCKPVGRLSVLIPELEAIATVTILTTSKHDIMSLQQALEAAQFVQQGRLKGIPFIVGRREREISTPGDDGKRARRKKSLLWIEPAHRYAIAALKAMDTTPLMLPAGTNGVSDDEDEEERIVDAITGQIPEIAAPYEEPAKEERRPARAARTEAKAEGPVDNWPEIPTGEERLKTRGDLFNWGREHFRVSQIEMMRAIGVSKPELIGDIDDAAEKIRGAFGRKPEEIGELVPPDDDTAEDGLFSEEGE